MRNIRLTLSRWINSIRHPDLQTRIISRVIIPPIVALAVVGVVAFAAIGVIMKSNELGSLNRVATATSEKVADEIKLRKKILISTGESFAQATNLYNSQKSTLDKQYQACHAHLLSGKVYTSAPDNSCAPFEFYILKATAARTGIVNSLNAGYDTLTQQLAVDLNTKSSDRLVLFTNFFPETKYIAMYSVDGVKLADAKDSGKSTLSDATETKLTELAKNATKQAVEGVLIHDNNERYIVFAYSSDSGVALAVYGLDSAGIFTAAWRDTGVDTTRSYVLFADVNSRDSYPRVDNKELYEPSLDSRQPYGQLVTFNSKGVEYLSVSQLISGSSWRVVVASPSALALGALANTQILLIAVIGGLLVGFLWAGTMFAHRTVRSIMALVGGAVIFSGGVLEHRINTSEMSDTEFARLAEMLNSMAERIKTAEDAVDAKNKEFISVATHEIRAPITGVIGFLSMVLEDPKSNLSDENKEMLRLAFTGTERLSDLVNDLLDIARLESGKIEYEYSQVDLLKAINDTLGLQRAFAVEHGSTLMLTGMGGVEFVHTDKAKLGEVLTNIVSNAIKYGRKEGGLVEVGVVRDGDYAKVSIKDNGMGIPADQQGKMFEKFFRVSTPERAEIVGTGLGMHISKQYIEEMGGKLWFDSVEGQGTTFYFTLALKPSTTSDTLGSIKEDIASA